MTSRLIRCLLLALIGAVTAVGADEHSPRVRMVTSYGEIILQLDAQKAPLTVANFLGYVDKGFYDGTVFHRVIDGFMIQGGGFSTDLQIKAVGTSVKNEADNGLLNDRGSIAMARTRDPHSANAQFFINTVDNEFLNHRSPTPQGWGYAVFGKVTQGMDVVDKISAVPTGPRGRARDVPEENVVIERVTRLDGE